MTHASVFSGIGGPEVAATMLGWENLFHCEINPFGRAVLDYWYPKAKSYDDITKTDFSEWRGKVDVLTGGFPCQPFSYAGRRRGAEDDRYLWPYMFKCIDQIQPTWVVAENVAGILTMVEQGEVSDLGGQADLFGEGDGVHRYKLRETFTLQRICDDLEGHGYSVQPVLIPACAVEAPHRRDRVFIVGKRIVADADNGADRRAAGQHEEQGREWNERNVGSGDSERLCREASRFVAADTAGSREGTPREGSGIEGSGSYTNQQPSQRRAETEWNSRFYELLRNAADTDCGGISRCGDNREQCNEGIVGQPMPSGEPSGFGDKQRRFTNDVTKPNGRYDEEECGERWRDFPTVSPVHRGNDGLPFSLDDLTISPSKWRTEALKAYGNAIVPQVMYEIFRAIEITQK